MHDYWNREGNNAYYSPNHDLIRLPLFEQFTDANEYYSTAFHESVHSTMKESRCNRAEDRKGKLVAFGSEEYNKEELVAEIGSANLMNTKWLVSDLISGDLLADEEYEELKKLLEKGRTEK